MDSISLLTGLVDKVIGKGFELVDQVELVKSAQPGTLPSCSNRLIARTAPKDIGTCFERHPFEAYRYKLVRSCSGP